jgi:hypothetical protein
MSMSLKCRSAIALRCIEKQNRTHRFSTSACFLISEGVYKSTRNAPEENNTANQCDDHDALDFSGQAPQVLNATLGAMKSLPTLAQPDFQVVTTISHGT